MPFPCQTSALFSAYRGRGTKRSHTADYWQRNGRYAVSCGMQRSHSQPPAVTLPSPFPPAGRGRVAPCPQGCRPENHWPTTLWRASRGSRSRQGQALRVPFGCPTGSLDPPVCLKATKNLEPLISTRNDEGPGNGPLAEPPRPQNSSTAADSGIRARLAHMRQLARRFLLAKAQ